MSPTPNKPVPSDAKTTAGWLALIGSTTEMGRRVADFDWASTALGPAESWSIGLRTAVGVCMMSSFPMMVAWGPDLLEIYNDGYRPMLGTEKHPQALGAPTREVWSELWETIGPMFAEVTSTGRPTWSEHERLMIDRFGFTEEAYFTFSYSALLDDDGTIGGVLDVVTETTDQVLAQRRMASLTDLGTALFEAELVTDVCIRAASALARAIPDVAAADIHLRVGEQLVLVASNRRDDVAPIDPDVLLDVVLTRQPLTVGGADDGSRPARQFAVAIGSAHDGVDGVLVTTLNPLRPFDAAYVSFLELAAQAVGAALDSAYRRAVEVGEYRQISNTLQAAMLKPASDFPTVAARYIPAAGNLAVGGDWYDVVDLGADRRGLVVGDCVGHGLDAATVMAQLRSAARAMLLEGRNPAATLEGLDLFAASVDGAFCATVVCAIFDRQDDVVTYSRAGHPPPLVVSKAGAVWLDQAGGAPLAVESAGRRRNVTHQLRGDDVIIMYSDGLIERRGENLDVGLARLADAASGLYGSSVHEIADGLLRRLLPEHARDDVVLVVKHLPRSGTPSGKPTSY